MHRCDVRNLLLFAALASPGVALAQAGMGTGGSSSGNQAGGVSAPDTPRDPTQVGRLQSSRQVPVKARDPDTDPRTRDEIRPEEGQHPPRFRPWR